MFVLLVVLLPLLVYAALVQRETKSSREDRALSFEASEQKSNVAEYFERSRALTQILAKNPSFASFYEEPGSRGDKIRVQTRSVREANEALAHLEALFPGSIGEACFIDASGPENARAVKGRIESIDKLSPDETAASFFAPTFALRPDQVYQSTPYVSPDTNEWVVANSAPIALAGRAHPAIVHFEVTLESLRLAAAELSQGLDVQIVDAKSGLAVIDTRHAYLGPELPKGLRRPALSNPASLGDEGVLTLDGQRAAYKRFEAAGENANDWIVVTRSRTQVAGWAGTVGLWQGAVFLVIGLLIPVVFFGWRRSQTELNHAANTDSLTGLGNRRRLTLHLERAVPEATSERPVLLAMFDLDGFKSYNDSYGHPAGDALLVRLAQQLRGSLGDEEARAYRMGGDEFCVVASLQREQDSLGVAARAADALREHGEGFTISASYGAVLMPTETDDPIDALRIADQRMYAQKSSSRLSASRQTTDVLVQMISEKDPDLGEHVADVVELATAVSRTLGLHAGQDRPRQTRSSTTRRRQIRHTPKHPRETRSLSAEEWQFIRQHTIIGERILSAAPALASCAKIVRFSHECWDGSGYPEGLAGEDIPLEARIIFVCDAFQAITPDRPYREARTHQDAVAELRRCAGTQFDPQVVRAFVDSRLPHLQYLP